MQKTRHDWQRVPLITLPEGKPSRPVSVLYRNLQPQTVVAAHAHNWGQLVYCRQGVQDVITPEGRFLIPPDRAVWVPPNEPHEISTLYGAEISSIYITPEAAVDLPAHCKVLEVSQLLRALILEALKQPVDYDWHSPVGRLFRTLRDQIAAAPEAPLHLPLPVDSRLRNIAYQLEQDPGLDLTLAQWGERVGASERTLQRLFQKEARMTFQQWRQQLRLQVALERLVASRDAVTVIATDLGYESASTFISMFQRYLGMTPGEYRKSLAK
ncbi:AraC family transcriptional regulator [Oceanobacter mangrovi]|uniref:AraC family transcriptional regulator n=1 Tax=Oceanobacter mangrovi TaxID=2862510 RepID=UPI001C8D07C6|nr:helix-turn-helix transcriptional regulator [Oceanobacter mangrovi]